MRTKKYAQLGCFEIENKSADDEKEGRNLDENSLRVITRTDSEIFAVKIPLCTSFVLLEFCAVKRYNERDSRRSIL